MMCMPNQKNLFLPPHNPFSPTFCKLSTKLNVCLIKCSPSEEDEKNQLNFQINVLVIRTLTKNIQKVWFFRELRCHFFKDFSHVECKLFQHSVEIPKFHSRPFLRKLRESNVFTKSWFHEIFFFSESEILGSTLHFRNFLSLRFYVKSILKIVKVLKLQF